MIEFYWHMLVGCTLVFVLGLAFGHSIAGLLKDIQQIRKENERIRK